MPTIRMGCSYDEDILIKDPIRREVFRAFLLLGGDVAQKNWRCVATHGSL